MARPRAAANARDCKQRPRFNRTPRRARRLRLELATLPVEGGGQGQSAGFSVTPARWKAGAGTAWSRADGRDDHGHDGDPEDVACADERQRVSRGLGRLEFDRRASTMASRRLRKCGRLRLQTRAIYCFRLDGMIPVEQFMAQYFQDRTRLIQAEIESRSPHRQKYFASDCRWDSRQGTVESSQAEQIVSVSQADEETVVVTTGKHYKTSFPIAVSFASEPSGDGWLIHQVESGCRGRSPA